MKAKVYALNFNKISVSYALLAPALMSFDMPQVRCLGCNEVSDKWQVVSSSEKVTLPGSRGEAHYVAKCKLCSKANSLSM